MGLFKPPIRLCKTNIHIHYMIKYSFLGIDWRKSVDFVNIQAISHFPQTICSRYKPHPGGEIWTETETSLSMCLCLCDKLCIGLVLFLLPSPSSLIFCWLLSPCSLVCMKIHRTTQHVENVTGFRISWCDNKNRNCSETFEHNSEEKTTEFKKPIFPNFMLITKTSHLSVSHCAKPPTESKWLKGQNGAKNETETVTVLLCLTKQSPNRK